MCLKSHLTVRNVFIIYLYVIYEQFTFSYRVVCKILYCWLEFFHNHSVSSQCVP